MSRPDGSAFDDMTSEEFDVERSKAIRKYDDADDDQEREQYEKDQLPRLDAFCGNCCATYGEHAAGDNACPLPRHYTGLTQGFSDTDKFRLPATEEPLAEWEKELRKGFNA